MANPENSSRSVASLNDNKKRKTHGRATLVDVARRAGVTTMTVSRTLRAPATVSAATAARVRAAVQETGYTPNKSAGLLASGRSRIVAALIPNFSSTLFAETIQGLSDTLQPVGLELLLAATGYSQLREEEQIHAVLGWAPSALVVTGRHHTEAAKSLMRHAREEGVPVIEMWDQAARAPEFVQVGFSHRHAGRQMLAHLLACGYRDLAYVDSAVVGDVRAHERRQGFLDAARAAGREARLIRAPLGEPMAGGRRVLQDLLDGGQMPHAMAFANDNFAAGACLQAQQRGIALASELGLMGFGDLPIASQLAGGISTLSVPRYEIGQCAAQLVLSELRPGEHGQVERAVRPGHLLPRLVTRLTTCAQ